MESQKNKEACCISPPSSPSATRIRVLWPVSGLMSGRDAPVEAFPHLLCSGRDSTVNSITVAGAVPELSKTGLYNDAPASRFIPSDEARWNTKSRLDFRLGGFQCQGK